MLADALVFTHQNSIGTQAQTAAPFSYQSLKISVICVIRGKVCADSLDWALTKRIRFPQFLTSKRGVEAPDRQGNHAQQWE